MANGKEEKAIKLKVVHKGLNFTMIEDIPNQIIKVTTTDAKDNQLEYLSEKRWRENNPEPEFTITMHQKIEEKIKNKNLGYCGHIFSIVIHTNFNHKETGLVVLNGKAANIASFGKIFKIKSRDKITKTLKELVADGFLIKEGTKYFLNRELHFMGKLQKNLIFSKLYHVSNRELLNKVSQEAVGLLYKVVPLVNFTNGSICSNPSENNNELVNAMIREDLANYLGLHVNTVTLRMNELIDNGVVLPIQIKNTVYYKVHPDFVAKIDYFAARAIKMMIEERKAVETQLLKRRREKQKMKKLNKEKKEGE